MPVTDHIFFLSVLRRLLSTLHPLFRKMGLKGMGFPGKTVRQTTLML
jgi:hypothetical protein